jgi:hypothetical protein
VDFGGGVINIVPVVTVTMLISVQLNMTAMPQVVFGVITPVTQIQQTTQVLV